MNLPENATPEQIAAAVEAFRQTDAGGDLRLHESNTAQADLDSYLTRLGLDPETATPEQIRNATLGLPPDFDPEKEAGEMIARDAGTAAANERYNTFVESLGLDPKTATPEQVNERARLQVGEAYQAWEETVGQENRELQSNPQLVYLSLIHISEPTRPY